MSSTVPFFDLPDWFSDILLRCSHCNSLSWTYKIDNSQHIKYVCVNIDINYSEQIMNSYVCCGTYSSASTGWCVWQNLTDLTSLRQFATYCLQRLMRLHSSSTDKSPTTTRRSSRKTAQFSQHSVSIASAHWNIRSLGLFSLSVSKWV